MHFSPFSIVLFSLSLFHWFVIFFGFSLFCVYSVDIMYFVSLFLFHVVGSRPFCSISVSFCFLYWLLLSSFVSFLLCFQISFLLSFSSSLLASHSWEDIALSVSLMYIKSFFKFSIPSLVKEVMLSLLVFVFSLFFCSILSAALFCFSP